MTFGGIYREVSLRIVPQLYWTIFSPQPKDVLSDHPSVEVECFLAGTRGGNDSYTLEAELRNGDKVIARGMQPV